MQKQAYVREQRERKRERRREKHHTWTTAGQCRGEIKIADPHENDRPESLHLTRTVHVRPSRVATVIRSVIIFLRNASRHGIVGARALHVIPRMNINIQVWSLSLSLVCLA